MAITTLEYAILSKLKAADALPSHPALLELGRSNWYGDVPLEQLLADLAVLVPDPARAAVLRARVQIAIQDPTAAGLFELGSVFWDMFLDPARREAIDLHGLGDEHQFDLNQPVPLTDQYDIVVNFGTAEHVFNVYQVFKTIHERTLPGGMMLHGMPFQGWPDHGFFNFQPTFYIDLAQANGYAVQALLYAELNPPTIEDISSRDAILARVKQGVAAHAMIFAVFRKPAKEIPFAVPFQGYYARQLTAEQEQAWIALR